MYTSLLWLGIGQQKVMVTGMSRLTTARACTAATAIYRPQATVISGWLDGFSGG